ncbi:MAG: Hsp33 family molecular chaperone HslO, partial [Vicinamibacteria bacterium]|nr:Hsp33 family molecular chaperone HslO [Vicinamibacteria bacterium]
HALDAYMARSEQIESQFALAADDDVCAGLLVQKVPQQGGRTEGDADPDAWDRIRTLASSLTRRELLELSDIEILHRLFHQEEVRLLPEKPVRFACSCTKERVASVLRALGRDEIQGLLADRRTIEVDCDFCGERYTFSAEEAWEALG